MSNHQVITRKGTSSLVRKTRIHSDKRAKRDELAADLYSGIAEWYEDTTCEELDHVTHGEALVNIIDGAIRHHGD